MLIDTREPPREPPDHAGGSRREIELDGRLVGWLVATLACFAAASSLPPAIGLIAAIAGLCAAWRTLEVFVGAGHGGVREWRQ